MAKSIQPDALVVQHYSESVIYELPFDSWDADLRKSNYVATVTLQTVQGLPGAVTVLPDDRAKRLARIMVRSPNMGGKYLIQRKLVTTSTPPEKRIKSFTVVVE